MSFSIISAIAKNNCIGKNNKIPWHIPEDFKYFKEKTLGKTCLMGRKTFESIIGYLGKPLPERKTVVITTNKNYKAPKEVVVFNSLDKAFKELKNEDVFICGGSKIYQQTINRVNNLFITLVDKEPKGDSFFPEIDSKIWKEDWREDYEGYSFIKYKRK